MNILVRNLPRNITEDELFNMFSKFGQISSHNIVYDKVTKQSKGFGYVEMPFIPEAKKALHKLNGKIVQGQKIRVKVTKAIKPKNL